MATVTISTGLSSNKKSAQSKKCRLLNKVHEGLNPKIALAIRTADPMLATVMSVEDVTNAALGLKSSRTSQMIKFTIELDDTDVLVPAERSLLNTVLALPENKFEEVINWLQTNSEEIDESLAAELAPVDSLPEIESLLDGEFTDDESATLNFTDDLPMQQLENTLTQLVIHNNKKTRNKKHNTASA